MLGVSALANFELAASATTPGIARTFTATQAQTLTLARVSVVAQTFARTQGQTLTVGRASVAAHTFTRTQAQTVAHGLAWTLSATQAQAVLRGELIARAPPYKQAVLATVGLVGYWRLDDASGTTAVDLKAANNGTYSGGYTLGATGLLASEVDNAASFDGSTGKVTLPNAGALSLTTGTLEAWIKTGSAGGSQPGMGIIGRSQECALVVNDAGHLDLVNYNETHYVNANTTNSTGTAGPALNDNAPHHVAVTFTCGGSATLYVDGVAIATNALIAANGPTTGWVIGNSQVGNIFFNGVIDEVAIYSTLLSATTIYQHWNIGSGNLYVLNPKLTQSQTPTLARSVARTFTGTQAASAGIIYVAFVNLAQSSAATRGASVARTPSSTQAQAPSISRRAARFLTCTQARAATLGRAAARTLSASVPQSHVVLRDSYRIMFTDGQAQLVSAGQLVARALTAVQAQAVAALRAVACGRAAAQSQAPGTGWTLARGQALAQSQLATRIARLLALGAQAQTTTRAAAAARYLPGAQAQAAALIGRATFHAFRVTLAQAQWPMAGPNAVVRLRQGQAVAMLTLSENVSARLTVAQRQVASSGAGTPSFPTANQSQTPTVRLTTGRYATRPAGQAQASAYRPAITRATGVGQGQNAGLSLSVVSFVLTSAPAATVIARAITPARATLAQSTTLTVKRQPGAMITSTQTQKLSFLPALDRRLTQATGVTRRVAWVTALTCDQTQTAVLIQHLKPKRANLQSSVTVTPWSAGARERGPWPAGASRRPVLVDSGAR